MAGRGPAPPPRTLVTFDVDGTLIRARGDNANLLHKRAFAHAFQKVFGVETTIDVIQHHGGTDPLILKRVLEHHGVQGTEVMRRLKEAELAMVECALGRHRDVELGLEPLPGVAELLRRLARRRDGGVVVALATGNLEPIGWLKMERLGLKAHFSTPLVGGFGSDFCSGESQGDMAADRGQLVRIARAKAERLFGAVERHVHVGDTPMDLKAAGMAGCAAVGVATGVFAREELEPHLPPAGGAVLDSLADVDAALAALGLAA